MWKCSCHNDAGSSWLEVFPCMYKATRNVVKCRCTIFSPFGIPYTVVADNGKELVHKDLKEWLTAQGSYKSDTPLYSPKNNGLSERAIQTLILSLSFFQ